MSSEMEIMLIDVGGRDFALPLAEVHHIVSLESSFRHAGADTEEYLNHEGDPLPFISTWNLLGRATHFQEYADLLEMLPQRRQDHLDWMAALKTSLSDNTPFEKARDPHKCAFGKWYNSYQATSRRLRLLLSEFSKPHAKIHSLADTLLDMVQSGHRADALALFAKAEESTLHTLLDIFDRCEKLLQNLQRRVAVIVEYSDKRFAIGADEARSSVTIPKKRITWVETPGSDTSPRPSLFILDDGRIVPCLDWWQLHSEQRI